MLFLNQHNEHYIINNKIKFNHILGFTVKSQIGKFMSMIECIQR